MQNAETSGTQHATRNTQHGPRFHVLPSFPALLRPGPDEQADGRDPAVAPAAVGLLAAPKNAECRGRRHATRNTQLASRLTPAGSIANRQSPIANPLPPPRGETAIRGVGSLDGFDHPSGRQGGRFAAIRGPVSNDGPRGQCDTLLCEVFLGSIL